jgi:hypothetical protein
MREDRKAVSSSIRMSFPPCTPDSIPMQWHEEVDDQCCRRRGRLRSPGQCNVMPRVDCSANDRKCSPQRRDRMIHRSMMRAETAP